MLDFNRVWLPYLYLYGVGGIFFFIGVFIILRSKSLKLDRPSHKSWFYILLFGFLNYMGIHAFFIFSAIGNSFLSVSVILILFIFFCGLIFKYKFDKIHLELDDLKSGIVDLKNYMDKK